MSKSSPSLGSKSSAFTRSGPDPGSGSGPGVGISAIDRGQVWWWRYYQGLARYKQYFMTRSGVSNPYESQKIWARWVTIHRALDDAPGYRLVVDNLENLLQDTQTLDEIIAQGVPAPWARCFYTAFCQQFCRWSRSLKEPEVPVLMIFPKVVRDSCSVTWETPRGSWSFTLPQDQQHRLRCLWVKIYDWAGGLQENSFNWALWRLIFRYWLLDGPSLQWAVPLSLTLNHLCQGELFASPLNVCQSFYFSLYEEDREFGSQGNFFRPRSRPDLRVSKTPVLAPGIYHVNPPFIESIFIQSSRQILDWLEHISPDQELGFIYIMPNWLDSQGYSQLTNSPFLQSHQVMPRRGHHYQSLSNRLIEAHFNTHIIAVGTDAIASTLINYAEWLAQQWRLKGYG